MTASFFLDHPASSNGSRSGARPNLIELEGGVSYDVAVLLDCIAKNARVASVRAAMEEIREAL